MDRKAFLDQEAPAGYVAGIGRGAVGFTTSADVGSASRIVPNGATGESDDEDDDEGGAYDENSDRGLFSKKSGARDDDDNEADKIYEEVERRLTRRQRENNSTSVDVATKEENGSSVASAFSDLKRALSGVSDDQWANLPEVGDLTKRNKRLRLLEKSQQRFYAVPDSVLAASAGGGLGGGKTDFQSISRTKDKLLSQQLDGVLGGSGSGISDGAAGGAGELDERDFADSGMDSRIEDLKKERLILASLRKTDPFNANAWIAAAKLEVRAKKFSAAKSIITEGCQKIPKNENLWLESARIHQSEGTRECKIICSEGLRFNPRSESLWLKAVELEHPDDLLSHRRILMRALESIPSSVIIWKRLIEIEGQDDGSDADVKKLLTKAVELCPKEWAFWLSLINLSEYSEAKSLINKARKAMNDNYQVWITAVKLEERENPNIHEAKLEKMMVKGASELAKHTADTSMAMTRDGWLKEASVAESERFSMTCKAVASVALQTDTETASLDEDERLSVWLAEAERWKSFPETSNSIFQFIIKAFPESSSIWFKVLRIIKDNHKNLDRLFSYYDQAIKLHPDIYQLQIDYALDLWEANKRDSAIRVIEACTTSHPSNEKAWDLRIQYAQLTSGTEWIAPAVKISKLMVTAMDTANAWCKYIHLLRCQYRDSPSSTDELVPYCESALEKYPTCDKLYYEKSQILGAAKGVDTLSIGVRKCPKSILLWSAYADSVSSSNPVRARAILDNSITQNPDSPELLVKKIQFERSLNSFDIARQLCSRALQKFPSDPQVWTEYLLLITKSSQRKNSFVDALKKTENSPLILLQIGLFFWIDGKFTKVKAWIDRALATKEGGVNGDCWAWMFKYLQTYGSKEDLDKFLVNYRKKYLALTEGEGWNKLAQSIDRVRYDDEDGFLAQVAEYLVQNTPQLDIKR